MTSEGWHERVTEVLRSLPNRTLVVCNRRTGIEMAVRQLHSVDLPLICVWAEENDGPVEMGNRLAEAVTAGLGTGLLGKNLPFSHGLKTLQEYQNKVGPLRFVFGWAAGTENLLQELLEHASPISPVLVISDALLIQQLPGALTETAADFLRILPQEAVLEARGMLSDSEVASLVAEANGQYGLFRSLMLEHITEGAPQFQNLLSVDGNWIDRVPVENLVEALAKWKRWEDVFDLACARAPQLLEAIIDDAGNHYFNRGAHEYVWARLSRLPPDVRRLDKIAYWLAASALATNRHSEQSKSVRETLSAKEAPELRALAAVARPGDNMLHETSRAVANLRSVATLRAHGFALALGGDTDEPIRIFREALRLADQDGAHHLVVACGIDLAEFEIRRGRYSSGVEWAKWALDEYSSRRLNERLRLMAVKAVLSFAYLLTGELNQARELVIGVDEAIDLYSDTPGFEAVISTAADVAFVSGEHKVAERLYKRNHDRAPIEAHCFTAVDMVIVLMSQARKAEAKEIADQAFALSRSSVAYERALGELAVGIAYCEDEPVRAERILLGALEELRGSTTEVHAAQAAIWLAILRLGAERRKAAGDALRSTVAALKDLGDSGWALLAGSNPMLPELLKLWQQTEGKFELKFLGARTLSNGTNEYSLSVRYAELLAILAAYPDGLHGEKLHILLYGDCERNSTLKSSVSRVRKIIPISSGPYAIDVAFKADFIEVLELLGRGELQRALNLYRGPLLPDSDSSSIVGLREHIDEAVRTAVLQSEDPDALIHLGNILDDDLEVWEQARSCLPYRDHRHPVVSARITRIKASWAE